MMMDIEEEFFATLAGKAGRWAIDQLRSAGVTFSDICSAGGVGAAMVRTEGVMFEPDRAGQPMLIQRVFDGAIPNLMTSVEEPVVADLIAWHLDEPARWWWRRGEAALALGIMAAWRSEACGEPLVVYRTPLSWLRMERGDGVCPLDDRCRSLLIGPPTLVAEDLDHARALDRLIRSADPRWPEIQVPRAAA